MKGEVKSRGHPVDPELCIKLKLYIVIELVIWSFAKQIYRFQDKDRNTTSYIYPEYKKIYV